MANRPAGGTNVPYRICLDCGTPFHNKGDGQRRGSRCPKCISIQNKDRNARRPWYRTPEYRAAQKRARKMLGQKCHRCGKGMTKDNPPSVDHVRAIAAGGSWTGPFQVICRSCNSSKRDKPDVGKGA